MKFVGKISGDGESFAWQISRDEFIRMFGFERYNEYLTFYGKSVEPKNILVYPEDIWGALGVSEESEYEFEITAVERRPGDYNGDTNA